MAPKPKPKVVDRAAAVKKPKKDKVATDAAESVASAVVAMPEAQDAGAVEILQARLAAATVAQAAEERQRSYLQLEKDKVLELWEVSRGAVEAAAARLRERDLQLETAQDRHAMELKIQQQRVKHLQYEQQVAVSVLKAAALEAAHRQQAAAAAQLATEVALQTDLQQRNKAQEATSEQAAQLMREEGAGQRTALSADFESQVYELSAEYERCTQAAHAGAEVCRREELQELAARKDDHIKHLMDQNRQAFGDMKEYYKGITVNSLDLIREQKADLAELRHREAAAVKQLAAVSAENRRLAEPLEKAQAKVQELTTALKGYQADKESLARVTLRSAAAEKRCRNVEWDFEVLQQRYEAVLAERDDLARRCEAATLQAEQAAGLQRALLLRGAKSDSASSRAGHGVMLMSAMEAC